ncbi:MAG: SRPBCC family protein [Pseudomonadales bacterium]|nr:SRPBCC family protein [Pseudomonadales bacterium]
METVQVQQDFPFEASKVWQLTGEFSGLKNWLPGVLDCQVSGEGPCDKGGNAERRVTLADNSVTRESLESYDNATRSYSYRILEAKGFSDDTTFIGKFRVENLDEGNCRVVWQAEFSVPSLLPQEQVEKLRNRITQMYQFFLTHLGTVLKEAEPA